MIKRIGIQASVLAVFVCITIAAPAAAHSPKPSSGKPYTTVDEFERSFTYSCPGGFDVIEVLVGSETIYHYNDRQISVVRIRGSITNSVSGLQIVERQHFKIIFRDGTVTFKGNLHSWYTPAGRVVQSGTRVYDISSGLLIRSHGRDDPIPNLCYSLS